MRSMQKRPSIWKMAVRAVWDGGPGLCHFAITSACNARCGFCSFARDQLPAASRHSVTLDEAKQHARNVGLQLLATLRDEIGSLDKVVRFGRVFGMVNAVPDFADHPKVINGCSDLFVEVFGDAGRHARSAVGNVMLPNQISVEIEGIVAVKS